MYGEGILGSYMEKVNIQYVREKAMIRSRLAGQNFLKSNLGLKMPQKLRLKARAK